MARSGNVMSQYQYQQSLKRSGIPVASANVRTSASQPVMSGLGTSDKYYVPGIGYTDTEPLVGTDENGNRTVMTSGVVREGQLKDGKIVGGKLSSSYDYLRNDTRNAIERWRASKGNAQEREKAMRTLYDIYRSRGEYTGSYDDFKSWWANRHSGMVNGSLTWGGAFQGIPTAKADGTPIYNGGSSRSGSVGFYAKDSFARPK